MAYTTINDPSAHFQTKPFIQVMEPAKTLQMTGNSNLRPDWIVV